MVLSMAGKAVSEANTLAAHFEAYNQRFQYQLDRAKSFNSRKRVRIDPNERFHNAMTIKVAVDRPAALSAQRWSKSVQNEAQKAAYAAAALNFSSMCTEWQIKYTLLRYRVLKWGCHV